MAERVVTIRLSIREDGGLRILSDDSCPGLILSGKDRDAVWRDLGPAMQYLLQRNCEWPEPHRPAFKTVN